MIFGILLDIGKPDQHKYKFSLRGAWPKSRDPYKIWHTLKHISKTSKARDFKFGILVHVDNFSKMDKLKIGKGAWPWPRDPYKIWHTLKHISKTSKARNFKFGVLVDVDNFSKMDK